MKRSEKNKIDWEAHRAQYALIRYLKRTGTITRKGTPSRKEISRILEGLSMHPSKGVCSVDEHIVAVFRYMSRKEKFIKQDLVSKSKRSVKKRPSKTARKKKPDDFYLSWEWTTLRYKALQKYGRRCMCCGAEPGEGVSIQVDHIKPRYHYPGLALDINNLQILCNLCNKGKGAWDESDYRP